MAPPIIPTGMVDRLGNQGVGQTQEWRANTAAYLAEGDMDTEVVARINDPAAVVERQRLAAEQRELDWPGLGYYRAANEALSGAMVEVVFIGDSITEMWEVAQPDLFCGGVINRGISGQTSGQILLRFMADVVALKPRVVHLMCGINDVAGNTGPTTPADYQRNILAMLDLARANGISVILAGMTPVTGFSWSPEIVAPRARVMALNDWLEGTARDRNLTFADYASVLADRDGALTAALTRDGVHPTGSGYDLMRPVADRALAGARLRA